MHRGFWSVFSDGSDRRYKAGLRNFTDVEPCRFELLVRPGTGKNSLTGPTTP